MLCLGRQAGVLALLLSTGQALGWSCEIMHAQCLASHTRDHVKLGRARSGS